MRETVLKATGAASSMIVTPPNAGLDFAAIKMRQGYMIVSADPITGVASQIGRYAMNVSANDVATSGNRPQFAESVVLLAEQSDVAYVRRLAQEMDAAAKELGIAIVGGHTEVTPGLMRPIIVVTAFSFVNRYVSSGDAREGDILLMTKTAGIEGTAAIAGGDVASAAGISKAVARSAAKFVSQMSIVDEAVAGFQTGAVHAMHDCTEGGVLGAAFEMSLASGLGFRLEEQLVPVADVTRILCERLSLDPLKLIGSGSLLLAVERGSESRVKKALAPICKVTRVGEFTRRRRILVTRGGKEQWMRSAPEDELWRVLGRPV
ncbi:MAG: AIR synthase-related protein [Thaumarchaeota archaeon]|nr:AIR synthase-related protein [Nitrososphaerota archaeon]